AGYEKEFLAEEWFIRDFNTWYLKWLAEQVRQQDKETPLHVNPHMIFHLLPVYDFPDWRGFLSSLGASMHPSWHFADFSRQEYVTALAANCEIIAAGAGSLPWYVTELQGGPNISSAYNPMTPTPKEFAQWLWQSVMIGTRGIIFWTLNPRATGFEAGEWALLDFQDQPTERMKEAAKIAGILKKQKALFSNLAKKSASADVTLIYNPESLIIQNDRSFSHSFIRQKYAAREPTANIYSVVGWHKALMNLGASVNYSLMEDFPWETVQDQVVVIPNMIAIPEAFHQPLHQFVQNGNRLIFSGLSGMYNEYNQNVMRTEQPFRELFGAEAQEYGFEADSFAIDVLGQPVQAHMIKGKIKNIDAEVIGKDDDQVVAVKNKLGKGEVIWIPSIVGLSAKENSASLANWIRKTDIIEKEGCTEEIHEELLISTIGSEHGNLLLLVNSGSKPISTDLKSSLKIQEVIYSKDATVENHIHLQPGGTLLVLINEK
ncbi:MAG: beta-galactosidase trimerization domain-containing protein, partial [Candidatus Cyclobacteriaceae bacterium M3_2C_046]